MKVELSLTEVDLRKLVLQHFQQQLPEVRLEPSSVTIEVKTANNYRAEWERGQFRARVTLEQDV